MEASDWLRDIPALRTVAIAAGLAALIGWEREMARKPAGLRTHILVGGASALLILIGDAAIERFAATQGPLVEADPIRVMQAVVVGISFLGAGTIVHARDAGVEGLTTAASVLLTAAIGMAVALGRVPLAVMVTLFAVAVIYLLGRVERRLGTDATPARRPDARASRLKSVPPGGS